MTTRTEREPFAVLMARADDFRASVADAIVITASTRSARQRLRPIEETLDDVSAGTWANLVLLDLSLRGSVLEVIKAQLGMVANDAFTYSNAQAMLDTFAPTIADVRRRRMH